MRQKRNFRVICAVLTWIKEENDTRGDAACQMFDSEKLSCDDNEYSYFSGNHFLAGIYKEVPSLEYQSQKDPFCPFWMANRHSIAIFFLVHHYDCRLYGKVIEDDLSYGSASKRESWFR